MFSPGCRLDAEMCEAKTFETYAVRHLKAVVEAFKLEVGHPPAQAERLPVKKKLPAACSFFSSPLVPSSWSYTSRHRLLNCFTASYYLLLFLSPLYTFPPKIMKFAGALVAASAALVAGEATFAGKALQQLACILTLHFTSILHSPRTAHGPKTPDEIKEYQGLQSQIYHCAPAIKVSGAALFYTTGSFLPYQFHLNRETDVFLSSSI